MSQKNIKNIDYDFFKKRKRKRKIDEKLSNSDSNQPQNIEQNDQNNKVENSLSDENIKNKIIKVKTDKSDEESINPHNKITNNEGKQISDNTEIKDCQNFNISDNSSSNDSKTTETPVMPKEYSWQDNAVDEIPVKMFRMVNNNWQDMGFIGSLKIFIDSPSEVMIEIIDTKTKLPLTTHISKSEIEYKMEGDSIISWDDGVDLNALSFKNEMDCDFIFRALTSSETVPENTQNDFVGVVPTFGNIERSCTLICDSKEHLNFLLNHYQIDENLNEAFNLFNDLEEFEDFNDLEFFFCIFKLLIQANNLQFLEKIFSLKNIDRVIAILEYNHDEIKRAEFHGRKRCTKFRDQLKKSRRRPPPIPYPSDSAKNIIETTESIYKMVYFRDVVFSMFLDDLGQRLITTMIDDKKYSLVIKFFTTGWIFNLMLKIHQGGSYVAENSARISDIDSDLLLSDLSESEDCEEENLKTIENDKNFIKNEKNSIENSRNFEDLINDRNIENLIENDILKSEQITEKNSAENFFNNIDNEFNVNNPTKELKCQNEENHKSNPPLKNKIPPITSQLTKLKKRKKPRQLQSLTLRKISCVDSLREHLSFLSEFFAIIKSLPFEYAINLVGTSLHKWILLEALNAVAAAASPSEENWCWALLLDILDLVATHKRDLLWKYLEGEPEDLNFCLVPNIEMLGKTEKITLGSPPKGQLRLLPRLVDVMVSPKNNVDDGLIIQISYFLKRVFDEELYGSAMPQGVVEKFAKFELPKIIEAIEKPSSNSNECEKEKVYQCCEFVCAFAKKSDFKQKANLINSAVFKIVPFINDFNISTTLRLSAIRLIKICVETKNKSIYKNLILNDIIRSLLDVFEIVRGENMETSTILGCFNAFLVQKAKPLLNYFKKRFSNRVKNYKIPIFDDILAYNEKIFKKEKVEVKDIALENKKMEQFYFSEENDDNEDDFCPNFDFFQREEEKFIELQLKKPKEIKPNLLRFAEKASQNSLIKNPPKIFEKPQIKIKKINFKTNIVNLPNLSKDEKFENDQNKEKNESGNNKND